MGGRLILGYQKSLPAQVILTQNSFCGGGYTSFKYFDCFLSLE
jgi:hypothetical protein